MRLVPDSRKDFVQSIDHAGCNYEIFAPGRVNLIGEHTDYNGGKVLPFAINLGLRLRCGRSTREKFGDLTAALAGEEACFIVSTDFAKEVLVLSVDEIAKFIAGRDRTSSSDQHRLPEPLQHSWARYVVGSLVMFFSETSAGHAPQLLQPNEVIFLDLSSSLPVGSGLSSSAALCCGTLAALCVLAGVALPAETISRMAMHVEHRFSGTKCGLMDQLAVMTSRAGHFTRIDFVNFPNHGKVSVMPVKAHEIFAQYTAVALNTGVTHSLANSAYNERRMGCEKALALLNQKSNLNLSSLGAYADPVIFQRVFGVNTTEATQIDCITKLEGVFSGMAEADILARRAAHAICENIRVDRGVEALQKGDLAALHQAMRESHLSLQNDYEVSCDELDIACATATAVGEELARKAGLSLIPVVGPRMTGGGFGGSTVQLVHNAILNDFVNVFSQTANPYTTQTNKKPTLIVSQPQNGLRIAIL